MVTDEVIVRENEGVTIAFFNCAVPAGFPSPAGDYLEERIDLNKALIQHPLSTFIIGCKGESMLDAFIPPKAKLIVDRSLTAKTGDIVLALVHKEFTFKYLSISDTKCFLVPANKKYKVIEVTPEMEVEIVGVVTQILIDPKDVKCML